jgi:hypothetical protein
MDTMSNTGSVYPHSSRNIGKRKQSDAKPKMRSRVFKTQSKTDLPSPNMHPVFEESVCLPFADKERRNRKPSPTPFFVTDPT